MKRKLTVGNGWILKCVTSRWGVIGHHGQKVASNCHVSNSIARCSIRCNTPWQGHGETETLLGSCLVWKKAQWLLKCIHMDVPYDAAILCLSVHPKEMYTLSNVKTRARVDCTATNCDQHLISRCTLHCEVCLYCGIPQTKCNLLDLEHIALRLWLHQYELPSTGKSIK